MSGKGRRAYKKHYIGKYRKGGLMWINCEREFEFRK
jgi:hypothetical protein